MTDDQTQSADQEVSEEQKAAQEAQSERDEAKEKMKQLEESDPPENIEDWPDDETKYQTYGGPEGPHSYHEGPEEKLGPSDVRHHEDGSVSVAGEKVEDPDEYKGDPIPGGPTDPDAPDLAGEREKEKSGSRKRDES
jgi:hypothetical protein